MFGTRFKLSVMMFLEFFIWGAWLPLIFGYLPAMGFGAWEQSLILVTFNVAALVALFFGTQFADRNFSAEKFLAFSHLVGGGAILALFFLQTPMGTSVGTFNSVTIETAEKVAIKDGKEVIEEGVGKLSDGTKVVVKGLAIEKAAFDLLGPIQKPLVLFTISGEQKDAAGKRDHLWGDASTPRAPFWPFFALMLVHSLFYVPTISITNSIAFANLKDAQKEFGPVRLWGTIGWIAASWPFVFVLTDWARVPAYGSVPPTEWLGSLFGTPLSGAAKATGDRYIFLAAGGASLLLAAFSFLLPHTPPKPAAKGGESLAILGALKLLAHPYILVLFLVTFLDAAIHQYYFVWTGRYLEHVGVPGNWVMPVMSIGQIAEIVTMFFLGFVLKSLGWRATMIVGILGHAARFAVFAFAPDPVLAVTVNVLHGICYAFFFATVYIFVDEYFPKDSRSSAQGLFNALILGLGPIATTFVAPFLGVVLTTPAGGVDYRLIFALPFAGAVFAALLLLLFFHPPRKSAHPSQPLPPEDHGGGHWSPEAGTGFEAEGGVRAH